MWLSRRNVLAARADRPRRLLWRSRRRGAAVVELAVILIPLMVVVIGLMEVGRIAMVQQYLDEAAQAGILAAVQPGGSVALSTSSSVTPQYAVEAVLANHGFSSSHYTVTVTSGSQGSTTTVTVSMAAQYFSWTGTYRFMASTNTITATASGTQQ